MLRIAYLTIALSAAFLFISCAEEEDPPVQKNFPAECIHAAVALPEGGFILVGVRRTFSSGGIIIDDLSPRPNQLCMVRIDDTGEILWEHDTLVYDSFEHPPHFAMYTLDRITAAITADGEIVIAGGNGWDGFFIAHTDTSGTLRSVRIFENSTYYTHSAIVPTNDGGFLFATTAAHASDMLLVTRTNSEDQPVFQQTYHASGVWDSPLSVVQTSDDCIFIRAEFACMKLSGNGDSLSFVLSSLAGVSNLTSAVTEPDNGFTVAATFAGTGEYGTAALLRFNTFGQQLWLKYFEFESDQQAAALARTLTGEYAIAGTTGTPNGGNQFCLLFADTTGIRTAFYTFPVGSSAELRALCSTPDGGFLLGGEAKNDEGNINAAVIRTTAQGSPLWSKTFGL